MSDYPAVDAGHVIEVPGSLSSKLTPEVRARGHGAARERRAASQQWHAMETARVVDERAQQRLELLHQGAGGGMPTG